MPHKSHSFYNNNNNNVCILPISLYGSDCWAVLKTNAWKINAFDQWCLWMLLGIKWHQFVRNNKVWKLMGQCKLTAIVQSRRLTLFRHNVHMDDNTDVKRILSTLSPEDWSRPWGRLCITWLSTIQQDLKCHNLTLPEAMDMAQNWSLWTMWSTYVQSRNDDDHVKVCSSTWTCIAIWPHQRQQI